YCFVALRAPRNDGSCPGPAAIGNVLARAIHASPITRSIMPVRHLFIAALMLFASSTAWAQYSNDSNQGASSSSAPSSTIPSSTTPSLRTPSSSDKSNLWGALAFTADGSWATAWTKPSKGEAEGDVAVACAKFGRGECKVVSFSGEYCAA